MNSGCAVLILAGGKSSRMGYPKPYLDFDGDTFVEKLIKVYRLAGVEHITIVMNRNYILPARKKLLDHINMEADVIVNENNVEGRFHSIQLGLKAIGKTDFCFIQNIDNPFTSTEMIEELFLNRISDGYVVPVYNGKGAHPILISESILNHIRNIAETDIPLQKILHSFRRKEVGVNDPTIVLNINTPEDYKMMNFNFRQRHS